MPLDLVHMIHVKAKCFIDARDSLQRFVEDSNSKEEKLMGWSPPRVGWLKLNTDGARKTNSGLAAAGGLLRNHFGDWVAGFSENVGVCSVLGAELWGVVYGLRLAKMKGASKLIIEVDNKQVADMLLQRVATCHKISAMVKEIQDKLYSFHEEVIQHWYREGNRCADLLALYDFSMPPGYYYFEDLSNELMTIITQDKIRVYFLIFVLCNFWAFALLLMKKKKIITIHDQPKVELYCVNSIT